MKEVTSVKRHSVRNDPISSTERERGAVRTINVLVDLEEILPTAHAPKPPKAQRD